MSGGAGAEAGQGARLTKASWYALVLVSSSQAISLLDRQILSILAPSIRADLKIGDAELGLLYGTVFALFYALFSLPLGRLVDGWVRTRLLGICLAAWSACAGLAAFAGGFGLLAISRLGVGVGEAAAQPAANSIIFDTFPRSKRGTAMAAMGIATALGLGLSMTLGGVVASWWDHRYPAGSAPGGFSGWQFAFLVAAIPGFILSLLILRLKEPVRGGVDGIPTPADPAPFKASGAVLAAVTPGANWFSLWSRRASASQWLFNIASLLVIFAVCYGMTRFTQSYSPRPPVKALGLEIDAHVMQWFVVGFGLFVIVNLFQSFKLTDKPAYHVIVSPSILLLMVVGGLQTSINYGVMGFTPSFLVREFHLSLAATALQFGLLSAAIGIVGPIIAGPLSDWLTARMGGKGRIWLTLFSLGVSPLFGIWTYSADSAGAFYLRFTLYSIILTAWMPPVYSLIYDLVLPRMRGIASSTYIIVSTLLGLGMGPYFVGIVSDHNGGDLGQAIMSVNIVSPVIVIVLLVLLLRINRDESTVISRARKGGEAV
ncbi:MAG: MFS transporter [Sphingobium sp.]|nr:MFS transporter [Sphingobium sp.]